MNKRYLTTLLLLLPLLVAATSTIIITTPTIHAQEPDIISSILEDIEQIHDRFNFMVDIHEFETYQIFANSMTEQIHNDLLLKDQRISALEKSVMDLEDYILSMEEDEEEELDIPYENSEPIETDYNSLCGAGTHYDAASNSCHLN